jgi:hypothetical protein
MNKYSWIRTYDNYLHLMDLIDAELDMIRLSKVDDRLCEVYINLINDRDELINQAIELQLFKQGT